MYVGENMFDDGKITVCITSYGRFDLLEQSINSFLQLNTYPIEKIIVCEDSARQEIKEKILNKFSNKIELIFNEQTIGQAPSIDKMYAMVNTQYILHSEDDYLYNGNPNFIHESISILEEKKNVHQVWFRKIENFGGEKEEIEKPILLTSNSIKYRMWPTTPPEDPEGWCGFSYQPHLKRTQEYHDMFPNGYRAFITPDYRTNGVPTEYRCNHHARKQGYRGAILLHGPFCNMAPRYPCFLA